MSAVKRRPPMKLGRGILLCPMLIGAVAAEGRDPLDESIQFVSYGGIPTWTGVASNWKVGPPIIHLYDSRTYRGHADFVSRGLKAALTFRQFKQQVQDPESREYLPFFLYDLRRFPYPIGPREYRFAVRLE